MKQYVMSVLTGKTIAIEIAAPGASPTAALDQAFTKEELAGPLLFRDTPLPPAPRLGSERITVGPNNTLPPTPNLTALGPAPQQSEVLILNDPYALTYENIPPGQPAPSVMETGTQNYYPVYVHPGRDDRQYLSPSFPNASLLYRRYWNLVYGEIVQPGTPSVSGSYAVTEGMQSTASLELAAELGLSFMGLGVTLTATFGFSVTISQSTTSTTNIQWTNPDPTKHWVVAKYQLVDDIVIAIQDESGAWQPLSWDGIFRRPGHTTKHPVSLPDPDSILGGTQFTQIVWGPF
ncbi:MAG: hypothetical protein H7A45_19090 [Verrucomicrobiales bacterium]|nr:hypothetical protein [Verrucomicrobiales bacterium]MCP5525829.1 hypothetical protein [Verrucomicrobiales bacterium]